MKKAFSFVAALAVATAALTAPVSADYIYGRMDDNNFLVKNISNNGGYSATTNAICGQAVRFSEVAKSAGPADLENVVATYTINGNIATVKLTANNTDNQNIYHEIKVNLTGDQAKLQEVAGSAKINLRNAQTGDLTKTIAMQNQTANIGTVEDGTDIEVVFDAEVACKEVPLTPITPETPVEIVKTGIGFNIGAVVAVAAIVFGGVRFAQIRNSRK